MGLIRSFGLVAAAGFAATSVAAQEEGGFRQTFDVEQRFEFGRNLDLTIPAEGASNVAATVLSYGLFSETPLDRLAFTASGALVIENSPDTTGTEVEFGRPEVTFVYAREVPDALFSVFASYISDDVSELADDLADSDSDGTQDDYGVVLRYEALRTRPASLFLEAFYEVRDYEDTTDPTLIGSDTYGLTAGTRLRFSEVLYGIVSVGLEREDNVLGITTDTVVTTFGLEYEMVDSLATAELTLENADTEDSTSIEVEWTRILADGELTFGAGWTETDIVGAIGSTVETDFSVSWDQAVNDVSSFGVELTWASSDSPGERIEETELGATYSYALTQDASLDLGASYRTRNDLGGRATSPFVFVALGRSF